MPEHFDEEDTAVIDVGPLGSVGRVRHLSENGRQITIEFQNGQLVVAPVDRPSQLSVGDVVVVREGEIEPAPAALWLEQTWVGVVKVKRPDRTVVDSAGRWLLVPTNTVVDYAVGNTVEVSQSAGVVEILHRHPIRLVDFGEPDESIVQEFQPPPQERRETFDDFGGLRDVVKRAQELIEVPLKHHHRLAKIKARPIKGVLFTGEPGTGKTMLARIIANQSGAEFLEISGPQFISKWVGQSEEILRLLFDYAAKQKRCIIFFDEIDSVAGQRSGESHESSRRVVAQLLTKLDGFKAADNVVVIAATNRPDDIDVALRRPGRFDWEIHFPYPDRDDREQILRTSERRHRVRGDLPHGYVAGRTDGWSGADLAAIWTEAAGLAVIDERDAIRVEDYLGGYERVATRHEDVRLTPRTVGR